MVLAYSVEVASAMKAGRPWPLSTPKRAETIDIRPASIVGERNDDALSGLTAYFEGAALEIHRLHPPFERLDVGTGTRHTAPTLIPILDAFLNADWNHRKVNPRLKFILRATDRTLDFCEKFRYPRRSTRIALP